MPLPLGLHKSLVLRWQIFLRTCTYVRCYATRSFLVLVQMFGAVLADLLLQSRDFFGHQCLVPHPLLFFASSELTVVHLSSRKTDYKTDNRSNDFATFEIETHVVKCHTSPQYSPMHTERFQKDFEDEETNRAMKCASTENT